MYKFGTVKHFDEIVNLRNQLLEYFNDSKLTDHFNKLDILCNDFAMKFPVLEYYVYNKTQNIYRPLSADKLGKSIEDDILDFIQSHSLVQEFIDHPNKKMVFPDAQIRFIKNELTDTEIKSLAVNKLVGDERYSLKGGGDIEDAEKIIPLFHEWEKIGKMPEKFKTPFIHIDYHCEKPGIFRIISILAVPYLQILQITKKGTFSLSSAKKINGQMAEENNVNDLLNKLFIAARTTENYKK